MHCISWCSISLLAFFPKNCFCTNLYKKKCCLFQSCLYIVNLSYLPFICRVFNMYTSFLFCSIVYLKKTKANSSKPGGTDMILILWTFLTAVHLQYVVVCAWSCSVHGSISLISSVIVSQNELIEEHMLFVLTPNWLPVCLYIVSGKHSDWYA